MDPQSLGNERNHNRDDINQQCRNVDIIRVVAAKPVKDTLMTANDGSVV